MENKEKEFITEDSGYNEDKNLSQRKLVLSLIKKINDENFKKSDNLTIETKEGIKILDIRETRINGIRDLNTLLLPNFDGEMKGEYERIKEEMKKLEEQLNRNCCLRIAQKNTDGIFNQELRKRKFNEWFKWAKKMSYMNLEKDTPEFNAYLEKKHELHQELFEALVFLLERINWLTGSGGFEE